jgi:drug/metabolite transporter (DMT)-like permease
MRTLDGTSRQARLPHTLRAGLGLALLAAVISGVAIWLNGYAVKQVADPAIYTTLKNAVAAAALMVAIAATGGAASARTLRGSDWGRLVVIGFVGGAVAFLLFFTGLAQATAPGAAFLQKTLFVWVGLLAMLFLGERLGWAQVLAMAVLLGGLILLAPPKLDGAFWGSGETMIAMATLLWAVEIILVKKVLMTVPSGIVAAARLGFGVCFLVGYLAITGSLSGITAVSLTGWAWIALTGVVLAAYVATWFAALERAPAGVVTSVLVVGAVITAGLQAISNGSVPQAPVVAGGVALAAATVLLAFAAMRRAPARSSVESARQ